MSCSRLNIFRFSLSITFYLHEINRLSGLLILNVVGFEGRQRALLALSGEDWLQVQRRSRILELSEVGLHLEVN
jgi:hypothetical protein